MIKCWSIPRGLLSLFRSFKSRWELILYWILRRLYMNKKLLRQQRKKVKKRMRTDAAIGIISGYVTLLEGAGWPGSFGGAAHLRGQRVLS